MRISRESQQYLRGSKKKDQLVQTQHHIENQVDILKNISAKIKGLE